MEPKRPSVPTISPVEELSAALNGGFSAALPRRAAEARESN